jgi:formamidase
VHYAQGDGEVAGTAIEMDATVIVRAEIVDDFALGNTTHFEGPSSLLDIPSGSFYATVGLPFKEAGDVPPDMAYLESEKVAALTNLSKDLSLAARNALERGLTREQAYVVMSVAVDLRIGQVVDAPNVAVSAILPLDIFVGE